MIQKIIGILLLFPGVAAFCWGALQLGDALSGIFSGAYKSTGYGLGGYILLTFTFFAVPLLIIGSALIFSGYQLLKTSNRIIKE